MNKTSIIKTNAEPILQEAKLLIWQLSIEINAFMNGNDKELRWKEITKYSEMLEIVSDLFIGKHHSYQLVSNDLITLDVLSGEKKMRMELCSAIERFFLVLHQAITTDDKQIVNAIVRSKP